MFKKTVLSATVLSGFVVFALGSGGMGNTAMVDACKNYVETMNSAKCLGEGAQLDASVTCPDELALSPIDLTEYYNCLADVYKDYCTDDGQVNMDAMSKLQDCSNLQ